MIRSLTTSPDGQWVVVRADRQVLLLAAGAAPAVGHVDLDSDDADLALVNGPPNVLIAVTRSDRATRVTLHYPPELDATARIELPYSAGIAAVSGGRLVMVSADHKAVTIVRASGRALASHAVDLQNGTVEFVAGIERNQLVVGQTRKLEVWDAVSGRPLRKLALELPPPPRTIGVAAGHMWVTLPGSDEVFVYRLSDGRPFRHYIGAPVKQVITHPASPLIVLVTPRNLVRLHCNAHSLLPIESPWQPGSGAALSQLVIGDDISLLGMGDGDSEPWRVPIGGVGSTVSTEAPPKPAPVEPVLVTAADKLDTTREAAPNHVTRAAPELVEAPTSTAPMSSGSSSLAWRDALVAYGHELARGVEGEPPIVAVDTELGDLAHRMGLSTIARRGLTAMYALHLVGEPGLAIARLAKTLGDWTEPLGQGQLAALAMIERSGGKLRLAPAVTDLIDGARPREIRLVGGAATTPHAGTFRVAREGRIDAEIEVELATRFGRIAIVEGSLAPAVLEARLHGATAITFTAPTERPRPWPQGAGLVLVLYGNASAWIADVPAL
jgi:hypothetical protein